jgi:hypothetical protein
VAFLKTSAHQRAMKGTDNGKAFEKKDDDCKPNSDLGVEQDPAEITVEAFARMLLEPHLRHAVTASAFGDKVLGSKYDGVGLNERINHLQTATEKAEAGDRAVISRLLAAQAIIQDNMFTELARRAAENMSEYINATERYGRLSCVSASVRLNRGHLRMFGIGGCLE